MLVKVTYIVCDRCGQETREDEIGDDKLALTMRFHDPASSSLLPVPRRETLEMCPDCREDFARWLGDRGTLIDGLQLEGTNGSEAQRAVTVAAGEDGAVE